MKVYIVTDINDDSDLHREIFGVFSDKDKAMKIKNDLSNNFREHEESYCADIIELDIDEPSEAYHWYMNN